MNDAVQLYPTNPPKVLIVSDEVDFSRSLMARWQLERIVPEFTVVSSEVAHKADVSAQALIIFGLPCEEKLDAFLENWKHAASTIICLGARTCAPRRERRRLIFLPKSERWMEVLTCLGAECLRRYDLESRFKTLEQQLHTSQQWAALGQYILEIRHDFNNALTSILGNAELMLLEPDSLQADMRDQVQTIHDMTLRLFEMMQRFSSLETEMQFVEKESQTETPKLSQAAAPGQ